MSAERLSALLVRLYPPAWRARYGGELAALVVEAGDGRVGARAALDVALGAARERLRSAGLARDLPPRERRRGGALLVLCSWALVVVAGANVQKLSEHWQHAVAPGRRALPSGAFDALVAGAATGTVLVLTGVVAALPALHRFARAGGVRRVRRQLGAAALGTLLLLPATAGLAAVAHHLNNRQRNGHDLAYGALFGSWSLLALATLAAWTVAGVAVARRLDLTDTVLRIEGFLAAAVAAATAAMTAATAVWWAALERSAPAHLAPLEPRLALSVALMLVASLLAGGGAAYAVRP